ncbi:MAG: cobalt transporter CbiM [Candidatus Hydrogenedentes bacterium]|nr:cobalt transporter CbiM [Candidatus Hydrogenedentota bacterium]
MHLAEGVITSPLVWGGGYVVAGAGVAIGLRKLDETQAMRAAVMASSFFVASLVHIPLFGVPVHLSLTGLLGIVLGWAAFPAVFVALILQTVLFGFGGITTLGINTCIMALPAVVAWYVFRLLRLDHRRRRLPAASGILGTLAVTLASLMLALVLATAGEALIPVAWSVLVAQLPVIVIEGLVTASVVAFLQKVSPELLAGAALRGATEAGDVGP